MPFYFNIIIYLSIGKSCLGSNKQAFHDRVHLNLYSSSKSVRNIKLFFSVFKCRSPSPTPSRQNLLHRAYIGLSVTSRLGCGFRLAYRARQPDPAASLVAVARYVRAFGYRLSVRLPRSVARAVLQYGKQHDLAL
jgi:hypothetical protein